jgi:hypothetical protein
MDIKEKYLEGKNFILSPRGKISRVRYFVYALILDILYRLLLSCGTVLGKEVSPILFILGFIAIPIIILKMFNYKKRAYSFLNNNILAYLYSIFYIFIGGFMQEYLYLLELSNKKGIYELTNDPVFQQYANIYIPNFINSNACSIIFYTLCGIGFIMYLLLLFYPTQNCIEKEHINKKICKGIKRHWNKIVVVLLSISMFIASMCIIYSEIHWRAYYRSIFSINKIQAEYINEIIRNSYNNQLNEYNLKKEKWENCLNRYKNISSRFDYCNLTMAPGTEPQLPTYYEFYPEYPDLEPILEQKHYEYFSCDFKNFKLFGKKCGSLVNPTYNQFHPYAWFWGFAIFMIPICVMISIIITWLIACIIKLIVKINLPEIINKFKNIFKNNTKIKRSNLSEKLQELNALKERGLITEEDYNNKKSQLLDEF